METALNHKFDNSSQWVKQIRNGKERVFEELFQRYYEDLYNWRSVVLTKRGETTIQTDIRLDVLMLDDRLFLVFGYYRKNKEDILIRLPVPTTSGIKSFQDVGAVLNSGFEHISEY